MNYLYPDKKLNPLWIREGINQDVADWAESFGKFLCDLDEISQKAGKRALTTSQLRRFFGEVKRIEMNILNSKADFIMLKPALAYAVGRDKNDKGINKTRIKEFEKEMTIALEAVNQAPNFVNAYKNFVKVLEAIIAYHKYYGGK